MDSPSREYPYAAHQNMCDVSSRWSGPRLTEQAGDQWDPTLGS